MLFGEVALDMSGYFDDDKEKRPAQLTARVPTSIRDGIKELAEFLTAKNRAEVGEGASEVTDADVIVRLLRVGLSGAWAQLGGRPGSKKEWPSAIARALGRPAPDNEK